jgi:hypothetical protein
MPAGISVVNPRYSGLTQKPVEIYQRFGGNCDLLHQGRSENGGCGFSQNADNFLPGYMVIYFRKDNSS